MEKTQISGIQLYLILLGFLFGSSVILTPALGAGRDAWLAMILAGVAGLLLMWVYTTIALLNPSKTLVEILRDKLGKVIGTILSVLYIWYFVHLAALVFRNFGEFICTTTLVETPVAVVMGLFALVLLYAVNSGVEVMGRMSELLVILIPVVAFLISIALITAHDFTAFLPVLENGLSPVIHAAFVNLTFPFGEAVAFLMVFPHLNRMDNLKKVVISSTATSSALAIFVFARDLIALGSDLIARATFIPHLTSLLIPEFNVVPLVDINLLVGGGVKISVCIYAAAKGLSQVTGTHDYRSFSRAVITFCVVLAVWVYENTIEMFGWAEEIWPYYSIPFQIIIPLLLLLLSLRGKNKPSQPNTENTETESCTSDA